MLDISSRKTDDGYMILTDGPVKETALFELVRCPSCSALVWDQETDKHTAFHDRVGS